MRKLRIVLFRFWLVLHLPPKKGQNQGNDESNDLTFICMLRMEP